MSVTQGQVVVGAFQSAAGLAALRYAVAEARYRRCVLQVVYTVPFGPPAFGPWARQVQRELVVEAWLYVRAAFDATMGRPPDDIAVAMLVSSAAPDAALLAAAGQPRDVIVIGGRPGRRPSRLARSCLQQSLCPVVFVPPPNLALTAGQNPVRRLLRQIGRRNAVAHPRRAY